MSRTLVIGWSLIFALAGGVTLGYLLYAVPPRQADGAFNWPVVALFWLATVLVSGGVGSLCALILQRRWPSFGGARRYMSAQPEIALRQGALLAAATGAIALLAFLHILDIVFVLVIGLLVGLFEVYLQNRRPR